MIPTAVRVSSSHANYLPSLLRPMLQQTDRRRERERELERERERESHRQRDKDTESHRHRETERQRDGDRERERDREVDIQTGYWKFILISRFCQALVHYSMFRDMQMVWQMQLWSLGETSFMSFWSVSVSGCLSGYLRCGKT